jgi:hypothetical protein
MSCPFYGYCAIPRQELLIESHGNQCGLISEAYAPCRMEIAGEHVDFHACELSGSARAREYEKFKRADLREAG